MTSVAGCASVLLHVTGVVQGVGFRPFVHRLATRHGLAGWVRNESGNVAIALEGEAVEIDAFLRDLRAQAPPLARIDDVRVSLSPVHALQGFRIERSAASSANAGERQPVSPDVAICADCERELYDEANRRHRYPFITCTNCGPRHSVIEAMPYDRERTSMRPFTQCPACLAEYTTVNDRRYHSETNSCPVCGPKLQLLDPRGILKISGDAALLETAALLREGAIVAIRGIGGFHLACLASDERAVQKLRKRKHRDAKPFAIMARSIDDVEALAHVSAEEAAWLARPERPIVVLRRRSGAKVADGVSGALPTIGAMLAYAPLQMLLLDAVGEPLVMTSGNRSQEPLVTSVAEALATLASIADAFLTHDREIVARIDDSVLRIAGADVVLMRRARGFAPLPVPLPIPAPQPLVAVGPHLKNTLAIADGVDVYPSQHIGDLETLETMDHWQATLASLSRLFRIEPRIVVRDMHRGYLSTTAAESLGLPRMMVVQHHHAHVAAVAAEHGVTAPVIGVAFDGTGMGDDDRIWGAELFVANLREYRRVGQLHYAPLPGGDLAVRLPWRTALGYLSLEPAAETAFARAIDGVPPKLRDLAWRQSVARLNAPEASSMGRLFDAAAAVLGIVREAQFEGEAAMRLEAAAGERRGPVLPFPATVTNGRWIMQPLPLLAALGDRLASGEDVADLAAAFHDAVVRGTAEVVERIAEAEGLRTVALGGGVFQNARLLVSLRRALEARKLRVLTARLLPANDGGISYGQVAVAAARLNAEAVWRQ